jgi:hypothetical protein
MICIAIAVAVGLLLAVAACGGRSGDYAGQASNLTGLQTVAAPWFLPTYGTGGGSPGRHHSSQRPAMAISSVVTRSAPPSVATAASASAASLIMPSAAGSADQRSRRTLDRCLAAARLEDRRSDFRQAP